MTRWLAGELAAWHERGLSRRRRRVESASGVRLCIAGRALLSFASNDYLALARDPRLARAGARAGRQHGTGAGASPLVCGHLRPHRALERDLARWEGVEAALLFSSGFAANLAAITALAGPPDAVFSDELNHASLIDGCRLSRAHVHVYRHADVGHLEELLVRAGRDARRRVIVTDSVFSMDGDFAPLSAIQKVACRQDAVVVVDEAHATGVLGEQGRGLSETLPPDDAHSLVKVGTLSKALGAQGGFLCGSRQLRAWLVNHARPYIFSTALAPPAAAAARRAIRIVQEEPARRRHLLGLARLLRARLEQTGLSAGNSACQIVPVIVGDPRAAMELSARLQERGLLVPAIRPPSVPEGTARLRISLSAGHSEEDVDRLALSLRECWPAAAAGR